MPRPKYQAPYQPKNKARNGYGPRPETEGRPVDVRISMGCYMQIAVESFADQLGCSQSAFMLELIREGLVNRGVVFR
jgi:hypothetical protein